MNELESKKWKPKIITDYHSPFDSAIIFPALERILKEDGWTLIFGGWFVGILRNTISRENNFR